MKSLFFFINIVKNQGIVGDHIGIDPLYIKSYMETLDNFSKETQYDKNCNILTYFNFISIHPFSDRNGRVGKTLMFIARDDLTYKGITTKKQHKKLCKELNLLQKKIENMFTLNINVDTLKTLLNY